MKRDEKWLLAFILVGSLAVFASAGEGEGVDGDELGLSKTSVFSTPDPIVPTSHAKDPGTNRKFERYFSGAPPRIPHTVEDYLPITIQENLCLECHNIPEERGQERLPGDPTPIPISHYRDLRRAPDKLAEKPVAARYLCIQCHATQTEAKTLVENSYRQ